MDSATLLTLLRECPWLSDAQRAQVESLPAGAEGDVHALVEALRHKGILTPYQARQIRQGKLREVQVGQYLLLEELGSGGFGQVFKARHLLMDRIVALKLVSPERCNDPVFQQRFLKEVRATTKLQHPNIVLAYDAAEVDGQLYLAMELIEGLTLHQRVHRHGPLPIPLAIHLLLQTAQALKYAHEKGMVHRDIKPANLLIPEETLGLFSGLDDVPPGLVKVVDFGLARFQTQGTSTSMSQNAGFLGTPDFVAPEQAQNASDVDMRADLYSLGCTFYFALAGQKPFSGGSPLEVVMQHLTVFAPPIQTLRPEVSSPLAGILRRLMEKNRQHRYASADQLIADLNHLLGKKQSHTWLPTLLGKAAGPIELLRTSPRAARATLEASPSAVLEAASPTTAVLPQMDLESTAVINPADFADLETPDVPLPSTSITIDTSLREETKEDPPAEIPSALPSDSPLLEESRVHRDLPEFWQTWLDLLERIIHNHPVSLSAAQFKVLHRQLLKGLQVRGLTAEPAQRPHYQILEALLAPWLSLQVLKATDRATLKNLLQRCHVSGNALGLRRSSYGWLIAVVAVCLLINLLPFLFSIFERGVDLSLVQHLSWLEFRRYVELHPVLSLALFIPTAVLILYSVFRRLIRR